jgi:HKD family nuclease
LLARRAYLAVAFVMASGVELLANSLAAALARGAEIRLLTTDYLGVTDPDALAQLIRLPGNIDVRLYSEAERSYHPKAYLFEHGEDGRGVAFIGSSNLSRSALEGGVEWNYTVCETDRGWPLAEFVEHFERLFDGANSRPVTPALIEVYRAERKPRSLAEEEALLPPPIQPRPAQGFCCKNSVKSVRMPSPSS